MAKKRFYKTKSKKKYSIEEKVNYHNSRYLGCGKYGLKFGGPGHSYSAGYCDAFHGIDNTSAVIRESGKRSGKAYALGLTRGEKASEDYFKQTGKQPFEAFKSKNR